MYGRISRLKGSKGEPAPALRGARKSICLFLLLVVVLPIASGLASASQYAPDDWISYTDLRHVSSVAVGLKFVYFGTAHGIAVYDNVKNRWADPLTTGDGLPVENIDVVGIDAFENRIIFSSGATLYSYSQVTEDCRSYGFDGFGDLFTSIGVDPEYLWAEGKDLKLRFDKIMGSWHPVSEFLDGIEWFGEKSEVDVEDPEYSFLAPFYVLGKDFQRYDYTAIVRDGRTLWVGTWGYGIYKYNLLDRSSIHLLMGVMGSRVQAMLSDGTTFWFGNGRSDSPGISVWNTEEDVWEYLDRENQFGLYSNRVSSIAADSEFVWLGTRDGLTRLDRQKKTFKTYTLFDGLPANEVTSLCLVGDSLWIGTGIGPALLVKGSSEVKAFSEVKTWVNDFVYAGDTLWVATEDGVFCLALALGTWTELEDPEGLLRISTTGLCMDDSKMWFGTGRGVICFDRGAGTWQRYTYPAHLPDERVTALEADQENIWIGTSLGFAQFRKTKGDWIKYGRQDGLIGDEVNVILSLGDHVYLGTDRGLTKFYWKSPLAVR
jgi:ligand-binding sensor domain-containing protein